MYFTHQFLVSLVKSPKSGARIKKNIRVVYFSRRGYLKGFDRSSRYFDSLFAESVLVLILLSRGKSRSLKLASSVKV